MRPVTWAWVDRARSLLQEQGEGAVQQATPLQAAGEHAERWDTEAMIHHIADGRTIELGFGTIDLSALTLPPVHVGPLTIDLSITRHVLFLFVASVLTLLTMWAAAGQARRLEQGERAPGGVLNAAEAFYLYLRDEVAMATIGPGGERFVPYVIALFFFILYANLLGLVPFGATATSNIMVTAGMALISLAVIEWAGLRTLGPRGYLGTIFYLPKGLPTFMVPIMLLIMTPVELIGKLAKPFALAVRLFANMTAGHFVILALLGLIVTRGSFSHAAGVVAILGAVALGLFVMFLEIFVAFLQAYIFAMLTSVFIGLIRHAH
ncbi:MAG: F0F1 ATP synthase subunit A [Gemmatimonadota bacterium]